MQSFWRAAFRLQYRLLDLFDPMIRSTWRSVGIGNVLELVVDRRDGKGTRSRMVGLLTTEGEHYLGHPSGNVGWTRDIAKAGTGMLRWPNGDEWHFRAVPLADGNEREAAIRATSQHPFPGNVVYRLGRPHVRREGVFFRLESPEPTSAPLPASGAG